MSSKSEKLVQRIQDVQKFATAKANRSSSLVAVAEELGTLVETLQSNKFKVKIASQYPILAQALDKLVRGQTPLASRYQFEIDSLPTAQPATGGDSPASLKIENSTVGNKTRYMLPSDRKITIGRNLDCHIQLPIEWSEVSRHHAEIRPFLNSSAHEASFGWMITDLNSANGTYINGKRLHSGAKHILQSGDRIMLGKPNTAIADPEFVFELQTNSSVSQVDPPKLTLSNCDILCLIINPIHPFSQLEKQAIERAHQAQLFKLAIIFNVYNANLNTAAIAANIAEVQTWISNQKYGDFTQILNLDLRPFYSDIQNANSQATEEIEKFTKYLENFADLHNEDTIKEQIKKRFLAQLSAIDNIFDREIQLASDRIKEYQSALGDRTIEEINEQIKKSLKQISEDKDKTFQQVKFEFNQSKASLVDPFSRNSLTYQLQQFTDELKPVITKEQGQNFLRLRSEQMPENESINNYATRFCHGEILKWCDLEWERICQEYQNGGLKDFFQRSYTTLNLIPTIKLPAELFQIAPKFEASKWLQASIVEFNKTHIAYQYPSKKGDAIAAAGAGAIAVAFGNPIPLIMAGIGLINKNIAQKQALDNRQEQQTEALRRGIYTHYQSLAKCMTDRVAQGFVLAFQTEERRIKEAVEKTVEEINTYLLKVKKDIENCKTKQNSLNKEKAELLEVLKKP